MEPLQILWVARSELHPGATVKSHSHPYYHMFYSAQGEYLFTVEGLSYELRSGQCLLVPPQTEHSYTHKSGNPGEYLEIKFALSQGALDKQLIRMGTQVNDSLLVGVLFQQILKEYSDLSNLADSSAKAYLNALLHALGEESRYQKQPQQFRHIDAAAYSDLAQRIIRYLETNYSRNISLDTLAQEMGYNKSYLCVAFKKDTHFTILDCLNMIRIRAAAEWIAYGDQSLSRVAELCGFASVSHFNRVFLKYAGITPGQCRRAYPANILFDFPAETETVRAQSDRFMYSVLAQKRITPDMIRKLDALEQDSENDP